MSQVSKMLLEFVSSMTHLDRLGFPDLPPALREFSSPDHRTCVDRTSSSTTVTLRELTDEPAVLVGRT